MGGGRGGIRWGMWMGWGCMSIVGVDRKTGLTQQECGPGVTHASLLSQELLLAGVPQLRRLV